MRRRLLAMAAAIAALAGCAPSPTHAEALMTVLERSERFSGALVIGRNGHLLFEGATGTSDGRAAFTTRSPADGASLAKTLTATAVQRLAEEGALDLDEAAQRYAPDFPYPDITVRQLLGHAAGLPDYDAFATLLESGRPVTTSDLLAALGPGPVFAPGAAFAYCNLCYDTLGLIVERVEERPLADVFERRFFAPFGMTEAFLRPARFADWPGTRVLGFRRGEAGALEEYGALDNEGFHGGSNVYLSARDLHAWASAWATGAPALAAVEDAARERIAFAGEPSGLTLGSWYCEDAQAGCYYTGSHRGFFSLVYWNAKSGATAAMIANLEMGPEVQAALLRAIVAVAEGRDSDLAALEAAASRSRDSAAALDGAALDGAAIAGIYSAAPLGRFEISVADGAIHIDPDFGPRAMAYPVGDGFLYVPGFDAYLSVPAQGRIRWMSVFADVEALRS